MKKLFKWICRMRGSRVQAEEAEPKAPLTRREKAKVAIHYVANSPPMGEKEKHMLGILVDYAADMPIPLIASRRHCSETTVNRRVNEAIQRWHEGMK